MSAPPSPPPPYRLPWLLAAIPPDLWLDADGEVRCVWCGGAMAMLTRPCGCAMLAREAAEKRK